jgi:hypothetical protein
MPRTLHSASRVSQETGRLAGVVDMDMLGLLTREGEEVNTDRAKEQARKEYKNLFYYNLTHLTFTQMTAAIKSLLLT